MRLLRELLLGARMALAGGASGWLRAGLTALGVGLGVALLLVAVAWLPRLRGRFGAASGQQQVQGYTVEDRAGNELALSLGERGHEP